LYLHACQARVSVGDSGPLQVFYSPFKYVLKIVHIPVHAHTQKTKNKNKKTMTTKYVSHWLTLLLMYVFCSHFKYFLKIVHNIIPVLTRIHLEKEKKTKYDDNMCIALI